MPAATPGAEEVAVHPAAREYLSPAVAASVMPDRLTVALAAAAVPPMMVPAAREEMVGQESPSPTAAI